MYISSFNKFDDTDKVVSFMQQYSFATIVSVQDGLPVATHLPFLVRQTGDKIILRSHFAKANSQWKDISGQKVLVIFTEPHAYISPKNYEKAENVPTWNYIAVHAYGFCSLLEGDDNKKAVLEETINYYDNSYLAQWNSLPGDYKLKMMQGIVAFEVTVDDLQAKQKLSQNRSEKEIKNIIAELENSDVTAVKDIAAYMKEIKVDGL